MLSHPGVVSQITLAGAYHFHRYCELCQGAEDKGEVGYGSLIAQIRPPLHVQVEIVLIVFVIALLLWWMVAATSFLDRWFAKLSPANKSTGENRKEGSLR